MIGYIPIWGNSFVEQISKIDFTQYTSFCLMGEKEFRYDLLGGNKENLEFLIEKVKAHNIPLHILTSAADTYLEPVGYELHKWPTFYFFNTLVLMTKENNKLYNDNLGLEIFNPQYNEGYRKVYITLNKAPKVHRLTFMDLLYKNKLMDYGYIVYRELLSYNLENWQQQVMLLDQTDNNNLFNQEILPKEYKHSFMQLVTESDDTYFFISEKTVVPLLFAKPFLIISCKDYHKKLQSFGFKLYDELFDYSFDSVTDMSIRYDMLLTNIKNLINKDLSSLYTSIIYKLKFNRNLAIQYALDDSKFPMIYKEIAKQQSEVDYPNSQLIYNEYIKNKFKFL